MEKCDLLIIGGGPSGLTAAKFAAKKGLRVLVIEEKKEIGIPVRCAGYVPWQIKKEIELKQDVIAQRIESMKTYFPDGDMIETKASGFIIHRLLFDKQLANEAIYEGAKILLNTKAIGIEDNYVFAKRDGKLLKIKPDFIMGADGPYSIVGRWIGQINRDFLFTAQREMRLLGPSSSIEVYFHKEIPGGYGWLFPKDDKAKVGVGVDLRFKISPDQSLARFIEFLIKQGRVAPLENKFVKKAISVGGILKNIFYKNMCLVGDSAGTCHPITGAGILNAIVSGRMAGENLNNYEEECKFLFEEPLKKAGEQRKAIDWSLSNDKLSLAIKKIWKALIMSD
ncbi:MAG: NAD(P)/FAD-dependent oxidoreductase [bacterium]